MGQSKFEQTIDTLKFRKWSSEDPVYGVTHVCDDGSRVTFLALSEDYKRYFLRLRDSFFYHIAEIFIDQVLRNMFYPKISEYKIRKLKRKLGPDIVDIVTQNLSAQDLED